MNPFEKILERLQNIGWVYADYYPDGTNISRVSKKSVSYDEVIKIVQEIAEEYNNGWIPCSERLPEYAESLVNCTIKRLSDGHVWVQNLIYNRIDNKWKWTDYPEDIYVDMDSFTILSWQPLPEPYQPKGE